MHAHDRPRSETTAGAGDGTGAPPRTPTAGLRRRLLVIFLGLVIGTLGLSCVLFYARARAAYVGRVQEQMRVHAMLTANGLDGAAHAALTSRGDPGYEQIRAALLASRAVNSDVRDVYTMARGDDGTWRFIVDAEPSDSDFFSEFGTPYDASQDPSQDLALERAQASEDLYTDEYGTWMSGYAPIRGPDGRAVGIDGVDMSAEAFRREEMLIAGIALLVFAVGVSLAAAAAHSLLGRVADPIVVDQELQAAASRHGGGKLKSQPTAKCH